MEPCTLHFNFTSIHLGPNAAIMSTETSKPVYRSQINAHLAMKNFSPNVPFGFLNRHIMYTCVPELPCLVLIQRTLPTAMLLSHW